MLDKIEQDQQDQELGLEIAVIGMVGRFPGANNIHTFWSNLKNGIESIWFFTDEELIKAGANTERLKNPSYIKARGVLEDIEYFDAAFFGYLPVDAEVMDPQIRIFHECVWEALEDAGYLPESYNGLIGLYAGASVNNNWIGFAIKRGAEVQEKEFGAALLFDKDFLTTRVSYKLNLKGPSSTVFTACSTSLVAIHQACQGLLSGECNIAVAGGISITVPPKTGYLYQEGMLLSADGHCRAFEAKACGTVFGSGLGVVVLKQLEEAVDNRDNIYAVIKGSVINNDGSRKVGYTAPGVKGQAAVIRAAHQAAEVNPESIGYIETHGTGTTMGDPIEIEALTQAFQTDRKGFCAIGSVKTNVGHLDIAAGAAGFIKTVLALKHKMIPPSLNFETPNPEIDFDNSPFYVNTTPCEWKRNKYPLRAGVSSFGIGGTNAHVVLEEAPGGTRGLAPLSTGQSSRQYQLILLSAKTETALEQITQNLANYLKENPGVNLANVAYTLQVGRSAFEYRKVFVCAEVSEAIEALFSPGSGHGYVHRLLKKNRNKTVVFMFPGQGSQYVNMGRELYQTETVFKREMDRCFEILKGLTDYNVKEILYPGNLVSRVSEVSEVSGGSSKDHKSIQTPTSQDRVEPPLIGPPRRGVNQTEITQPVIFVIEYALARLLMHWGIKPDAMIGHSIGEYTAACLAGVFSLEDALALVALRGKLMQQMPGGAMLSVPLPEDQLTPLLNKELALAAVNGPGSCVISGPHEAVNRFAEELKRKGYEGRSLHTSHAFHSSMMDPVLEEFREKVRQIRLNKPKIPYTANVTGKWITDEEAVSPGYWTTHLRKTIRFSDGLKVLLEKENCIFVEVGPGQVLSMLARKQAKQTNEKETNQLVINLVRHPREQVSDSRYLLSKLGHLWLYGKTIDGDKFYPGEKRCRISLPTYPFERQRYWAVVERTPPKTLPIQKRGVEKWFYIPSWKRSIQPVLDHNLTTPGTGMHMRWLVFSDSCGLGSQLVKQLEKQGRDVISIRIGEAFEKLGDNLYTLNPRSKNLYDDLFDELRMLDRFPGNILHLWNVTGKKNKDSLISGQELENALDSGFYSLLSIAQAIGKKNFTDDVRLIVVTDNMQEVVGGELLFPHKAAILGPVQVINREYPRMRFRSIDIVLPPPGTPGTREHGKLVDQLLAEILAASSEPVIAYRNEHRWTRTFEPVCLDKPRGKIPRLKERGVYLVTGGLGGIGFVLAEHLARSVRARLILTGRSSFPHKSHWDQWIEEHEKDDPVSLKIEKVKELERIGAEVIVFNADVTHLEQMQEVITRSKERFGTISGVIHAAGLPDGALIQLRTPQASAEVLAPKVKGTLVLDHVLRDEEPDFFMLCSSIMAALAPIGQVGYCAANTFLDAFAFYKTRRDSTFTLSVNWDIWQEVGMAVNANAQNAPNVPKFQHKKLTHPFFDKYMADGEDLGIFVINLSVSKHWFLDEHRILGSAIVLGTVYLEMARAAFEVHVGHETVEIRDVYYLNPLMVGDNEEKELRLVLKKKGDYFEFFFLSPSGIGKDEWKPHARGEIASIDIEADTIKKNKIKDIEARCNRSRIILAETEHKPYEGSLIGVGPRWDSLIEVKLGEPHQGLARFQLPDDYWDDMKSYKLHPALLDYATSYLPMMDKHIRQGKGGYLPFSYKRLRMKGPIPTRMFSYSQFIKNKSREKETLSFNVAIIDEEGNEWIDIEGFTLLTISDEGKPIAQKVRDTFPIPSYISVLSQDKTKTTRASKGYPGGSLKTGILPTEGIEVFNRIIGSTMPQVMVSTRDLEILLEQINGGEKRDVSKAAPQDTFTGTRQMRPELSSIYVAPRDKTEQMLEQILKNYLGIDKVGIHDNFFEIGASSLDIVRISGRLEKSLKKELPIAAMFSHPTIRDLRNYLEQEEKTLKFSDKEKERLERKGTDKKARLKQRKRNIKGDQDGR